MAGVDFWFRFKFLALGEVHNDEILAMTVVVMRFSGLCI
jgi:hypothetical protein